MAPVSVGPLPTTSAMPLLLLPLSICDDLALLFNWESIGVMLCSWMEISMVSVSVMLVFHNTGHYGSSICRVSIQPGYFPQ